MDNINIALIKYHNDNSSNKYYDEMIFYCKRQWHLENNKLVIDRWDLDSQIPSHSDIEKYTTTEINELVTLLDEIQTVKNHKTVLISDNKTFLKSYAKDGSMIYEPKTKKMFLFYNNEWLKI